jgi:hypothetical protein
MASKLIKKFKKKTTYTCTWCYQKYLTQKEVINCWDTQYDIWTQIHPFISRSQVLTNRNFIRNRPEYLLGKVIESRGSFNNLEYLIEYRDESRDWRSWFDVVDAISPDLDDRTLAQHWEIEYESIKGLF